MLVPFREHHLAQVRRDELQARLLERERVVLLGERERGRRRLNLHRVAELRLAHRAQARQVEPVRRHQQVLRHRDVQLSGGIRRRGGVCVS